MRKRSKESEVGKLCRPAAEKPVNHGAALDPGLLEESEGAVEERDDQATKGTRWMPRRQEAKKDVGSCEKPRGAANQALIRGCPNGETHGGECRRTSH